jgi:hypothetical protein
MKKGEVVRDRSTRWRRALANFVYGLTGWEFARHALEMRREVESLFMVLVYGDLVGVPVMPPSYSLRLLPYVVRDLPRWKRAIVRRRDFWEREESHLHGI